MPPKTHQLGFVIAVAVMLIGVLGPTLADKPPSPAEDKIRRALGGKTEPNETGNPVLDDVLNIIKRRGSILDGSILDDRTGDDRTGDERTGDERTGDERTGDERTGEDRDRQRQNARPRGPQSTINVIPTSRQALVAEQLLKSSRLLERLETPDQQRTHLIQLLRAEAVSLLLSSDRNGPSRLRRTR